MFCNKKGKLQPSAATFRLMKSRPPIPTKARGVTWKNCSKSRKMGSFSCNLERCGN